MKPHLSVRFNFGMKTNFSLRFDFSMKPNFRNRFDFCPRRRPVLPQLIFIVSVGDFCSTSHFYIYIVCVDRSGSLSGSAFNQLKLVTLNIVLTILYLHKTVLQKVFVTVSLYISPAKSSNIYSRHPHCNIK